MTLGCVTGESDEGVGIGGDTGKTSENVAESVSNCFKVDSWSEDENID